MPEHCLHNTADKSVGLVETKCRLVDFDPSNEDGRVDVFDCIERFSNPWRRHSTLDYLSPVGFEETVRFFRLHRNGHVWWPLAYVRKKMISEVCKSSGQQTDTRIYTRITPTRWCRAASR